MDFNAQANHWDTDRRKQRAKQISALIREKLEFTGDEVLLDYGCGTGLISFNLSQGVGTVVGYDSSLQMLEVFNSKIDSNKILSTNSLESYNNHFDCVVSSMVFHHIMNLDETLDDIYGFEVSEGFISDVTDKILPQIEEWQSRPLSSVYPIVFVDAIHFSVDMII